MPVGAVSQDMEHGVSSLKVTSYGFELINTALLVGLPRTYRSYKAVVDMILYQNALRLPERLLHSVQLLRQLKTGFAVFHPIDHAGKVTLCSLETLDDVRV